MAMATDDGTPQLTADEERALDEFEAAFRAAIRAPLRDLVEHLDRIGAVAG